MGPREGLGNYFGSGKRAVVGMQGRQEWDWQGTPPSFWLLPPTRATLLVVSPQSGLHINDEAKREAGGGEERQKQGL